MPFVKKDYQSRVFNIAHCINLLVQSFLYISAVEFAFTSKLFEQPIVEISRCKVGIGGTKDDATGTVKLFIQMPQRGGFSDVSVPNQDGEKLLLGGIDKLATRERR